MGCLAIYLYFKKYMIGFNGSVPEYLEKFKKGILVFNDKRVLNMSLEFIDFIDQCLTWDFNVRPKAERLLNHPFLAK